MEEICVCFGLSQEEWSPPTAVELLDRLMAPACDVPLKRFSRITKGLLAKKDKQEFRTAFGQVFANKNIDTVANQLKTEMLCAEKNRRKCEELKPLFDVLDSMVDEGPVRVVVDEEKSLVRQEFPVAGIHHPSQDLMKFLSDELFDKWKEVISNCFCETGLRWIMMQEHDLDILQSYARKHMADLSYDKLMAWKLDDFGQLCDRVSCYDAAVIWKTVSQDFAQFAGPLSEEQGQNIRELIFRMKAAKVMDDIGRGFKALRDNGLFQWFNDHFPGQEIMDQLAGVGNIMGEKSVGDLLQRQMPRMNELGVEAMDDIYPFVVFWDSMMALVRQATRRGGAVTAMESVVVLCQDPILYENLCCEYPNEERTDEHSALMGDLGVVMGVFKSVSICSERDFSELTKRAVRVLKERQNSGSFGESVTKLVESAKALSDLAARGVTVVDEFKYVRMVRDDKAEWMISREGTQLVTRDGDRIKVLVSAKRLKLIVPKLNVTMVRSNAGIKEQFDDSDAFVERFHDAEALRDSLIRLHNWHFSEGDKSLVGGKSDSCWWEGNGRVGGWREIGKLEQKKQELRAWIQDIEKGLKECHKTPILRRFTESEICLMRNVCVSEELDKEERTHKLHDILYSHVLLSNSLDCAKRIVEQCDGQNMSIGAFSAALKEFMKDESRKCDRTFIHGQAAVIERRLRPVNHRVMTINEYADMHWMILYFYGNVQKSMPHNNQILICSCNTTKAQVDSFIGSYKSDGDRPIERDRGKRVYIVALGDKLDNTLWPYLIERLGKCTRRSLSGSLMILLRRKEAENPERFGNLAGYEQYDGPTADKVIEWFQARFKIDGDSLSAVPSCVIYSEKPLVGKTQTIMKWIYERGDNNIYHRITVDASMSLTDLIRSLLDAPRRPGLTTYVHFNVDARPDILLSFWIHQLAMFHSLNDGSSMPFVFPTGQMVLIFEFAARSGFDRNRYMREVFPIGLAMEDIPLCSAFSFDEYEVTRKAETRLPVVSTRVGARNFVAEAAALVEMHQDKSTNALLGQRATNYEAFLEAYRAIVKSYLDRKDEAFDKVKSLYGSDSIFTDKLLADLGQERADPLLSQVVNVAKMISVSKGPIIGKIVFEQERDIESYGLRRLWLALLIQTVMGNIGLPYQGPKSDEDLGGDTKRAELSAKLIYKIRHIVALMDPLSAKDQDYRPISLESDLIDMVTAHIPNVRVGSNRPYLDPKRPDFFLADALDQTQSEEYEKCPSKLFEAVSDMFALSQHRQDIEPHTRLLKHWQEFTQQKRADVTTLWTATTIQEMESSTTTPGVIEGISRNDPVRIFMMDCRDRMRYLPFKNDKKEQIEKVPLAVEEFIARITQWVYDRDTVMIDYTFTLHTVLRFTNIVYRYCANLPLILSGETGSGKTFTLKFLAEIISGDVRFVKRVIDGGTTVADIASLIDSVIQEEESRCIATILNNDRIGEKMKRFWERVAQLVTDQNSQRTLIEGRLDDLAALYVQENSGTEEKKQAAYLSSDEQREIEWFQDQAREELSKRQILIFFDEINTSSCVWYLKEIVVDRYFRGMPLPSYIHFLCAGNPRRELPEELQKPMPGVQQLDNVHQEDKLVYKVKMLPQSFGLYMMSADPERKHYQTDDEMNKTEPDSEFELSVQKIVNKNLAISPHQENDGHDITDDLDEENPQSRYCDSHHFSGSGKFSIAFDRRFFARCCGDDAEAVFGKFVRMVEMVNIYCVRFLCDRMFFGDFSFVSLRDPERCVRIMRWFFKSGIGEDMDEDKLIDRGYVLLRLRKSFILSLVFAYQLRLTETEEDVKTGNHTDTQRHEFLKNVLNFWTSLNSAEFRPPTEEEWQALVDNEQQTYADIFVTEEENLSKNKPLKENIWASYVCIMNNIPLWLFGEPGTSKSISMNIVLENLMTKRSESSKVQRCPPVVSSTFMCSNKSQSEAIMSQVSKLVTKARMLNQPDVIIVQLLEEISHADQSRDMPLKCLHSMIDNGYELAPSVHVPVLPIGLSNFSMDSAKLNRGVTIIRSKLNSDELKQTAVDIFQATVNVLKRDGPEVDTSRYKPLLEGIADCIGRKDRLPQEKRKFAGLRDFYGLIQCLAKLVIKGTLEPKDKAVIIGRNFSGVPGSDDSPNEDRGMIERLLGVFGIEESLDGKYPNVIDLITASRDEEEHMAITPIARHILVCTQNRAAYSILEGLKKKACVLFNDNISGLPDDEWISNQLREFVIAMRQGKTVIFIGSNPMFTGLYDVFNLRYHRATVGGVTSNYALISYGGDSHRAIVGSSFRVVIIVDRDEYEQLHDPFLNRFEKFIVKFSTKLAHINGEMNPNGGNGRVYKDALKAAFGVNSESELRRVYCCCCVEHCDAAILTSRAGEKEEDIWARILLAFPPALLVHSYAKGGSAHFARSPSDNPYLHSTVSVLLEAYERFQKDSLPMSAVSSAFFNSWTEKEGIQAIIFVKYLTDLSFLEKFGDFEWIDTSDTCSVEERIREIKKKESQERGLIVVVVVRSGDTISEHLTNITYELEKLRRYALDRVNGAVHTLIMIETNQVIKRLKIPPTADWPALYLDSCHCEDIPVNIQQLLFHQMDKLISDGWSPDSYREVLRRAREKMKWQYGQEVNDLIDELVTISSEDKSLVNLFQQIVKYGDFVVPVEDKEGGDSSPVILEWARKRLLSLPNAPSSLYSYLGQQFWLIWQNFLEVIFGMMLNGVQPGGKGQIDDMRKDLAQLIDDSQQTNEIMMAVDSTSRYVCRVGSRLDCHPGKMSQAQLLWNRVMSDEWNDCSPFDDYKDMSGCDDPDVLLIGAYLRHIAPDLVDDGQNAAFTEVIRVVHTMLSRLSSIQDEGFFVHVVIRELRRKEMCTLWENLSMAYAVMFQKGVDLPEKSQPETFDSLREEVVSWFTDRVLVHKFVSESEASRFCADNLPYLLFLHRWMGLDNVQTRFLVVVQSLFAEYESMRYNDAPGGITSEIVFKPDPTSEHVGDLVRLAEQLGRNDSEKQRLRQNAINEWEECAKPYIGFVDAEVDIGLDTEEEEMPQ